MRLSLVALLAGAAACTAQLVMPNLGSCDWTTLPVRMQALDAVCCFDNSDSPNARCAGVECSVDCAATLLPLLETCRAVIDMLFDSADGREDGRADQFDSVYQSCMGINQAEALAALAEMQSRGDCTDEELDGVGETTVAEAPCRDVRDGCDRMVSSGFMTCAADFSPTGALAGACDLTCGLCVAGPPPPPDTSVICEDRRAGCSATIASGFVSCEADFCATCSMAGDCGALSVSHIDMDAVLLGRFLTETRACSPQI